MKINLDELKDRLHCWYYECYGQGFNSSLSESEARILYDCMVVVKEAIKNNQEFVINGENRP